MLQVKSSRTLELEYLFVSFVVLWGFGSIFDSVPSKVSFTSSLVMHYAVTMLLAIVVFT